MAIIFFAYSLLVLFNYFKWFCKGAYICWALNFSSSFLGARHYTVYMSCWLPMISPIISINSTALSVASFRCPEGSRFLTSALRSLTKYYIVLRRVKFLEVLIVKTGPSLQSIKTFTVLWSVRVNTKYIFLCRVQSIHDWQIITPLKSCHVKNIMYFIRVTNFNVTLRRLTW